MKLTKALPRHRLWLISCVSSSSHGPSSKFVISAEYACDPVKPHTMHCVFCVFGGV